MPQHFSVSAFPPPASAFPLAAFSLLAFRISAFPHVPHGAHSTSSNLRSDPFHDPFHRSSDGQDRRLRGGKVLNESAGLALAEIVLGGKMGLQGQEPLLELLAL